MTDASTTPAIQSEPNQALIRSVAREIAMDILPLESVLSTHKLNIAQWDDIKETGFFKNCLSEELAIWASSPNAAERIRIKFTVMLEESAPEMFQRLHDRKESLAAKVELIKTLMKGAGVGVTTADTQGPMDRISIQINMGAGNEVTVQKDITPRVIDHEEASL
jgi:hypothetical protein